jgi:hypothetical protein
MFRKIYDFLADNNIEVIVLVTAALGSYFAHDIVLLFTR